MALCSCITPGGILGAIWSVGDESWISETRALTQCTLSPELFLTGFDISIFYTLGILRVRMTFYFVTCRYSYITKSYSKCSCMTLIQQSSEAQVTEYEKLAGRCFC